MKYFDEQELRTLLAAYEICEPPAALVQQTVILMRKELARSVVLVPDRQRQWVMAVLGSAVILALSFFYMLSVGTVLRMVVPPQFAVYLSHSLYAFTAAELCLITGTLMVLCLRNVKRSRSLSMAGLT